MICDYEGSDYKTRFWQNADRVYEDAAERVAMRRLLPPRGGRLVEFGAGFGRLADLYSGYDEIILLDYSRTLLEEAMQRWGGDPRFRFVAADLYRLPFAGGAMDAATMVRVIHHIADVPAALAQIRRVMAPGAVFVLEFANKRNAKAVARYLLRRQSWNPFDARPVEFARLNYDFHPAWMLQHLRRAGFAAPRKLCVSYLRSGLIKRTVPVKWMVYIDAVLQRTAAAGLWSPSVFTAQRAEGQASERAAGPDGFVGVLRSPKSGAALRRDGDTLVCDADGTRWRAQGNFYDLKEELRG